MSRETGNSSGLSPCPVVFQGMQAIHGSTYRPVSGRDTAVGALPEKNEIDLVPGPHRIRRSHAPVHSAFAHAIWIAISSANFRHALLGSLFHVRISFLNCPPEELLSSFRLGRPADKLFLSLFPSVLAFTVQWPSSSAYCWIGSHVRRQ